MRSMSSGSTAIRVTEMPSSSSSCPSHAAFVLIVSPERSSLPIDTSEAVTRATRRSYGSGFLARAMSTWAVTQTGVIA